MHDCEASHCFSHCKAEALRELRAERAEGAVAPRALQLLPLRAPRAFVVMGDLTCSIERIKLVVKTQDVNLQIDFAMGGITGSTAKPFTASVERIKLMMQTQDTAQDLEAEARYHDTLALHIL